MLRTWTGKAAVVAAVLVAASIAPAIPAQAADALFTAGFEEYPVNTQITNQYPFVTFDAFHVTGYGFTFGSTPGDGVVVSVTGNPFVTATGAHSGTHAAQIGCGSEFCSAGTFGTLQYTADSLSVSAGERQGTPLELDAYDVQRNLIGSATATSAGSSATTRLSVTAPSGKAIAYFDLHHKGTGAGYSVLIDDLTIAVPPGTVPQVGVSASASSYQLGEGGTITVPLTIQRRNGATGSVTVAVTGFTAEVTGSVPQPGTASSTTLTIHATGTAPLTNVRLTLSASAIGADSAPAVVVGALVIAPVSFVAPTSVDAQTCTPHTFTVTARIAPGEPGGSVAFSSQVAPTSSSAGSGATTPGTINQGVASTQVTVTNPGAGTDPNVVVDALLQNGLGGRVVVPVHRVGPTIMEIAQPYSKEVVTPQAQHTGTKIAIVGHGFCDHATVRVGNDRATDGATVQHLSNGQGPYDLVTVRTPRLATSGPVSVLAGSPPIASGPSTTELAVDSYRNTKAWKFHNFDPALSFADMTQAFGVDQTYLTVDPCSALTLGLGHCPVAIAPDPVAYGLYTGAVAGLESGTCFGMALSTQRLLEGRDHLPGTSSTIFDRPAPDTTPAVQYQHGLQPVVDLLKADHVMQLSLQFLSQWVQASAAAALTDPSFVSDDLATHIRQALAAGRYPLIEMQDGGGHVVVAYDIASTGPHAYDVYVYDSNDPFTVAEADDADTHRSNVLDSVIHLGADGSWSLASTRNADGQPWHGGRGGLVVTDPDIIPTHPTIPTAGAFEPPGLLSGSDGSTRSAARITQVASTGRTLYTAGGALNTDPRTRLAAAPMAPFVSSGAPATPLIAVSGQVHRLQVTTAGTRTGAAVLSYAQGPYLAQLRGGTSSGQTLAGAFDPSRGTVSYTGSSHRKLSLSVTRDTRTSARTVAVALGAAGRQDSLELSGGGAITLSHQGPKTSFAVTLSGGSAHGVPRTFTSQPVSIGPGQVASIGHLTWGSLRHRLTMTVSGHKVVLRDHARRPRHGEISMLKVSSTTHHLLVRVRARFPKLPETSVANLVLLVHAGQKLLATLHRAVPVRRPVTQAWRLKLRKHPGWRHRRLTFTAILTTAAPRGLTTQLGIASRSARSVGQ